MGERNVVAAQSHPSDWGRRQTGIVDLFLTPARRNALHTPTPVRGRGPTRHSPGRPGLATFLPRSIPIPAGYVVGRARAVSRVADARAASGAGTV